MLPSAAAGRGIRIRQLSFPNRCSSIGCGFIRRNEVYSLPQPRGASMQFLIHGADQKTGREMTIVVDARDQSEAEQRVLYNDILISSLARFSAPPPAPPRLGPLVP